jgi:hypothetical protein
VKQSITDGLSQKKVLVWTKTFSHGKDTAIFADIKVSLIQYAGLLSCRYFPVLTRLLLCSSMSTMFNNSEPVCKQVTSSVWKYVPPTACSDHFQDT